MFEKSLKIQTKLRCFDKKPNQNNWLGNWYVNSYSEGGVSEQTLARFTAQYHVNSYSEGGVSELSSC
mgnify:CR=1 FL=1